MAATGALLYLLRFGNGINRDDCAIALPGNEREWREVFRLAREQAVLGVCLLSMGMLPECNRPARHILLQWIAAAEQVRRQNRKVNDVLAQLMQELHAKGIDPIVVKGQVMAREYVQPESRMSGDIDMFFAPKQWGEVEKWVLEKGLAYRRSAAEKHIELSCSGVEVELHYHLHVFATRKAQDYWEHNIEYKAAGNARTVSVAGCSVMTLGVTETLLHLMVHAHHHLLTEGVGLRQLLDMTLFLDNHFDEIDFGELERHLHGIGHYRAFTAYCALMNKYLGLPKEKIPYILGLKDYALADKIIEEVWRGGNFGYKNNLEGVRPGLLHSMNTARLVIAHSWKFRALAPAEARGYWWNRILWRMKREGNR